MYMLKFLLSFFRFQLKAEKTGQRIFCSGYRPNGLNGSAVELAKNGLHATITITIRRNHLNRNVVIYFGESISTAAVTVTWTVSPNSLSFSKYFKSLFKLIKM